VNTLFDACFISDVESVTYAYLYGTARNADELRRLLRPLLAAVSPCPSHSCESAGRATPEQSLRQVSRTLAGCR